MRVIWHGKTGEERVLALGTFDGVHRGHMELIRTAGRYARERGIPLRVCTFDRHPLEIVRPEAAPALLTTVTEKASLMARTGVDEMLLIRFRKATFPTNHISKDRARKLLLSISLTTSTTRSSACAPAVLPLCRRTYL